MNLFAKLDEMEQLRLKPRKPAEEVVENWDDDDFVIGDDEDLTFRSHSAATTSSHQNTNTRRRESRRSSLRSDHELPQVEERQVHLPGNDKKSTLDAIAAATLAGIPIPTNVSPSALMGGTIKRLGGRKIKQIFQEDWGDELELPISGQTLRLKARDGNTFPEVLRQVSSSTNPSPAKKSLPIAQISPPISPRRLGQPIFLGASVNLEKYRDTDDDDVFGDGPSTIKASKLQIRGRPLSLITPPTPSHSKRQGKSPVEDDFENDLELPSDGKLKLSSKRDIPKTPTLHINEDFDWVEGSLGTRFGGTRRGAFSNGSSSVSAMSPSIASSFTAESEDEFFDGLIIPNGPLDLSERLKRRTQSQSPSRLSSKIPQQDTKNTKETASPKTTPPRIASPKTPPKTAPLKASLPKSHLMKTPPLKTSPSKNFRLKPSPSKTPPPRASLSKPSPSKTPPRTPAPKTSPPKSSKTPPPKTPPTKTSLPKAVAPKTTSPTRHSPKRASPKQSPSRHGLTSRNQAKPEEDDLVSGLDLGEGNVFRYAKPTVHRNVKVKEARPVSPARPKAAVSITFTNKPINPSGSRIPRSMISHERSHTQSSLEPVYESGGTIPQKPVRRPPSRVSGHSAHSSISSIYTPTTPSTARTTLPSPPRRRQSGPQKAVTGALRADPSTTSAQLLRLKRSLPAMRHSQSPAKPVARSDRPPSGGDSRTDAYRPQSSLQPKTPIIERTRPAYESSAAQARKGQAPFLPAGASQSQSHNVNAKAHRSQGSDVRPTSRTLSRNAIRSPSPRRSRNEKSTTEPAWQQINKPRRVRHFGDGHELDAFDDLPTSTQTESRYVKQPTASGNKTNFRNKMYQNVFSERTTPSPVSPYSPSKVDSQPHFARDTTASRMREAGLVQRTQPSNSLATLASRRAQPTSSLAGLALQRAYPTSSLATMTTQRPLPTGSFAAFASQRVAHISGRGSMNPHVSSRRNRSKKSRKPPQLKPHLISNLGSAEDSKVINGMTYNPTTFRWEGNENVLNAFDPPASSPSTTSQPMARERDTATPRPVLITNINTKKEMRRIGDMVFDPQNMCWLKIDAPALNTLHPIDPTVGFAALEEEDPFKDIPDLEDKVTSTNGPGRVSDIREDWLVGEEFDVGPEFVRRQHEEEARWRRKCEKWTGKVSRDQTDWRWAIRDLVMQGP